MNNLRIGFGTDVHKITSGDFLTIGTIKINCKKSFIAHSDGDILLHALTDALLGALALGDIGDYFPPDDNQYKNKPSSFFVIEALKLVKQKGYVINNIDSIITLESPKLKNLKLDIKNSLANLLAISTDQVSVKAKTNEGMDSIGQGLLAKAEVVVLLLKVD